MKDHCTLWPDGKHGICCKKHDECYNKGGNKKDRKKCDIALRKCVEKKSGYWMALTMYLGVRFFGMAPHHFKRDIFFRKRK